MSTEPDWLKRLAEIDFFDWPLDEKRYWADIVTSVAWARAAMRRQIFSRHTER